ncbi:MAG: hypothetical protein ACOYY3_01060 [Chloroflexota bacterium]
MPKPDPVKLSPDEILIAEFNYIAQTAFQANEDRARVTSFYFVSVGSLVAAILGTQFAGQDLGSTPLMLFAVLFTVLTGLGILTIKQLARLRAAWHESAEAMNTIKDFYIKNHPAIEPAFKWHKETLPPTDKKNSIANLMAVEVSLLGALTTGAAIYFLMIALNVPGPANWIVVGVSILAGYIAHWRSYKRLLVDDR